MLSRRAVEQASREGEAWGDEPGWGDSNGAESARDESARGTRCLGLQIEQAYEGQDTRCVDSE